MQFLDNLNSILSGAALPIFLLLSGIVLGWRIGFFYILHPIRLCTDIKNTAAGGGVSPMRALTVALAGTLGVGNISGVAAAIAAGGAGAVFWMWMCALLVMSVKYAEVCLAQEYRQYGKEGQFGGAMYYMRDGLVRQIGKRGAAATAAIFALLVAANSLITGNIIQVSAAAEVFPGVPPIVCGALFAVISAITAAGGLRRVSDLTLRLIPVLSMVYTVLSLAAIISCRDNLGTAIKRIFTEAFSFDAAAGGVLGFGISRAVRFGVTRGILSNEAGCGTAPTAHAAASAKSPHHQGCMGIFEVFADTIVLCTVTALVILSADASGSGISAVMATFDAVLGSVATKLIGICVILFALATVICQSYYGISAVRYFGSSAVAKRAYIALFALSSIAGALISTKLMWQLCDLTVAVMTIINMACVLAIFKRRR